jgi:hypothetical protein
MNYRELLMKYMNHVGYHEGIDYTDDGYESDIFTGKEWEAIQRLSRQAKLKGE